MPRNELTKAVSESLGAGAIQVETTLPVRTRRHKSLKHGRPDAASDTGSGSRIPRITRLMALAIKFQDMVERGGVCDYADLARLGYVTRARVTQIMNLLNLAPEIQEQILFRDGGGGGPAVHERLLRSLTTVTCWSDQREVWTQLRRTTHL